MDATRDGVRFASPELPGVALVALRPETEPDEDTEWTGIEQPTGRILVQMVGDRVVWALDPADLTVIGDGDWCGQCGQIGCGHG
jgi:hypothetical protein